VWYTRGMSRSHLRLPQIPTILTGDSLPAACAVALTVSDRGVQRRSEATTWWPCTLNCRAVCVKHAIGATLDVTRKSWKESYWRKRGQHGHVTSSVTHLRLSTTTRCSRRGGGGCNAFMERRSLPFSRARSETWIS
jgi:hypothetical protein